MSEPVDLSPGDAFLEALARRLAELLVDLQPKPEQTERQEYFSVRQAVEYTRTTEQTVRNALRPGGRLKSERRGKRISLSRQALDDWMQGRT